MLDDVLAALDHLAALGHRPLGVRGSSLGGFLARGFWHATGDERVPWQTTFALSQRAPHPRHLRIVMRGHHRSLQHDAAVLRDTAAFLRVHLHSAEPTS